jgi:hypothetical protein
MATPSVEEVKNLHLKTNLTALCGWAGMDSGLQDRWASLLGFPGGKVGALHPRVVAALPADMYLEAMATWKVGTEPASFFDKSLAMLVHTTAAELCKPDAPAPAVDAGVAVVAKSEKKLETRKIKVSNLIDPTDDMEVPAASADQLKGWYDNYKALKHGEPLIDKEPTPDQIAALHLRIITLGMEPYADFSLLTPFGRRVAKVLRHRSWIMQEDGTYRPMDVPGPESYEVWDSCFKVYEVILLMLRFPRETTTVPESNSEMIASLVVTPMAIEAYHEAFGALSREHPECWHLCQKAEDRCRAEHFPRLARKLMAVSGKQPTWSEVFIAASEDDRYWDREVRRPALSFMARGKRGQDVRDPLERRIVDPMRKKARFADDMSEKVEGPAAGDKKKNRGKGKGGKGETTKHPHKDSRGRFISSREGKQICFSFANGERGACKEPCKDGRAHICQICLQPHSNQACNKRG